MKYSITLRIDGEPRPQPRPRFNRSTGHAYNPSTANDWKKLIKARVKQSFLERRLEGPVRVQFLFLMPRPKKHFTKKGLRPTAPYWHTIVPDKDNLEKAVLDALTDVGLWKDDAQVCSSTCIKRYVDTGEQPGLILEISEL